MCDVKNVRSPGRGRRVLCALMAEQIDNRDLRSALEYVVLIAAEGQKNRRLAIDSPKELRPYFSAKRIPTKALGRIRRAVESNPEFRELVAIGAAPELVDDVGRLWLQRPSGWEAQVAELLDAIRREGEEASLEAQLRSEVKKRDAAQRAAARLEADLLQVTRDRDVRGGRVEELLADVAKLEEERDELRQEVTDARLEARHARDREEAAKARWAAAERDKEHATDTARQAAELRDEALASRAEGLATVAEIESALHAAQTLASQLSSLLPTDPTHAGNDRPATRTPLSLPGGIISTSAEAADYLVRSDAAVLIDGYNVTKFQWAQRSLEKQREMLLDAVENLVRRFGTDATVVFDGASVVGAHTKRRRVIRVVYSPDGVIADDVIRDEVRRLPTSRPVVVVTNDKEIVRDVRADGANTISSEAFLAIL